MQGIKGADRLLGFDRPTVWTIMTPLAVKTNSINLGQGFPSWSPPQFFIDNLKFSAQNSNHQYTRAFGSLNLVKSIADYHRKMYPNLNPQTNICTVNGGVEGLYCCFMGLVNEGEEVVLFDPSYDCYRPQVQMAGGKTIGMPLKPTKLQTKQDLEPRFKNGEIKYEAADDWQIDWELLEKTLNPKTKVLLLNSPHNPTGKVFTLEELKRIAKIVEKHPQIVIVEDNVYQDMTFDDMFNKPLPKMLDVEGMADRTLSIYSAGKIFAATGVRNGWVIGHQKLVKAVRSVHQYNVFCQYNITENTVSKSLDIIGQQSSTYMKQYATKLTKNRNLLLEQLLACKFDFNLWVPKGGYFIMADISKIEVMEKYKKDEKGNDLTKDYAFAYQLAHENGVVCIPCSPFYGKDNVKQGEKYVRFAFCKDEEMIREAGKRLSK